MAKITFIKPTLETDAIWDPIRTSPYLGIWYLASDLKNKGHEVTYLDEVVRDNGLTKQTQTNLITTAKNQEYKKIADQTIKEFQKQKMNDFKTLTPENFVRKYSAFKEENTVKRRMIRTGQPISSTINKLEELQPDIVGIPLISSANYLGATQLASEIKNKFPKTKIIFGGQHTSWDKTLQDKPYVDHVVVGDGIGAIDKIIEGNAPKTIYGGFQTMDKFPLLDPKILENVGYPKQPTHTYPTNGRKAIDFMFSKGCFNNCEFCVAGSQKNRVTTTKYERLSKQLKLFKEYEVKELVLQDDAFLWDRRHVQYHLPAVLGLMKKEGLYWQNNGGVEFEAIDDFVTEQLIHYNKYGEGKVTSLYVPFNPRAWNKNKSASKSMTGRYHKNLENLKRLREEGGIYVFTSAIIGTPEQTKESILEELETDKTLIQKGYIDAALCLSATMLPATQWFKKNGHNIVNKNDWAGYSLFTTHHRTEHLSPQDIEEAVINWNKTLDPIQKTYKWGTAFPNSE